MSNYFAFSLFLTCIPVFLIAQPDTLEQKIQIASGLMMAERISDSVYLYSRSNPNKARYYVEQSFELAAQNHEDDNVQTFALLNKGVLLSFTGPLDSAIYYLEEARQRKTDNTPLAIKILAVLGKTYISAANAERGLIDLFEALKLLKQAPNITDEMKIHSNIMWAYLELKRYSDCVRYGRFLLEHKRHRETEWIIPYLTNNMAASYGALNNPDSARYYVELGIPIAEANKDNGLIANGYFILGNIYANQGQFSEALRQFERAQPYRKRSGSIFYQVADLYVLADLYYKTGDYQRGLTAGLTGLKLAQENKLTLKLEGVYQTLAKNYEALNDFKNAMHYYKLLAAVKDSVYQKATANALAEMETRYETEKKELLLIEQDLKLQQSKRLIIYLSVVVSLIIVIVLIGKRQLALKERERLMRKESEMQERLTRSVITSQENERARFAKDLHDGFGQLISSVRLFINQSNESWVPHVQSLLNEMHQEIRNIAFALLPQTLISDGLVPALRELSVRLSLTGKISILVNGPDLRCDRELEVSIYRVCQEWINNILKYAHAKVVHINLRLENEVLNLIVEDDGAGFNPAALQSDTGNGWKNIQSRIRLHGGTVLVESITERKGSILVVEIPLRQGRQRNVA